MMTGAASPTADATVGWPVPHAWWRAGDSPADLNGPPGPPAAELGADFLDRAIFESFAAMARCQPTAIAVRAGGRSITYGELHARAASLAASIDAATEPGAAVAVLLPDLLDEAAGILACLAAGRPCIHLNPDHPAARLTGILTGAKPGGMVLPPGDAPATLPFAVPLIPLRAAGPAQAEAAEPGAAEAAKQAAVRSGPQDGPGLVIYTSGSTGQPKGIVLSQRQVLVRAGHRIRRFRLTPADRTLLLYPLSSSAGGVALFAALLSGGQLHVASGSAINARLILGMALDAGVTTIGGVPALLRVLFALDGAGAAFAHLRSIYTSSESLLRQDLDAWRGILPPGFAVRTGYGLTEGAPLIDWFLPPDLPDTTVRLPIGYPVPWHDFAITDAAGEPVADAQPGELWVRSRLLSLGEWQQGRCVPGRLLPDPDDPAGAVLRTGDLVRRRRDGLMEFLGRIDDQIRVRGNRVEPAEIELAMRQTQGVADAAILARRTAGDPVLVGFVVAAGAVATAGGPVRRATAAVRSRDDAAERLRCAVIARLAATLPPYMLPARVHVIAAVAKLPGGKVDPAALALLDDAWLRRTAAASRGPLAWLRDLLGFGRGNG